MKILEGLRKLFRFKDLSINKDAPLSYEKKLTVCLKLVKSVKLDTKYFLKLSLDKRIFIHIKVLYRSIDQYVKLLERLTYMLSEGEVFHHGAIRYELIDTTLESFLITTDGYYLDQEEFITLFVKQSISFLETFLHSKGTYSDTEYDHNLRLSAQLVDNLFELMCALKSA